MPRTWAHGNGTFRRKRERLCSILTPACTLLDLRAVCQNDLSQDTIAERQGRHGGGKAHIQNLLNFFPVIGEDEEGEMTFAGCRKSPQHPGRSKSEGSGADGLPENFPFQNIQVQCAAVLTFCKTSSPSARPRQRSPSRITSRTPAQTSPERQSGRGTWTRVSHR